MLKKTAFLILINIFLSVPLFSDTVFVYIGKGNISEETGLIISKLINGVENGVMESFFDNGHIVFSDNSAVNQIDNYDVLNQLAKRGGANILIAAVMDLQNDGENIIISGNYSVYNLFEDKIIYKGNYSSSSDSAVPASRISEYFFTAGKLIGDKVINAIF